MSQVDDHGRPEPPIAPDETATRLGFLDYHPATLARKCGGLDTARPQATVRVRSTGKLGSRSGRPALNLRPPEPHPGALPGCATPRRVAYCMPPPYPPPQAGEGKISPPLRAS